MAGLAPTHSGPGGRGSAHLALRLRNDPLELRRLAAAVDDFFDRHAVSADIAAKLNLALDELLTNVMRHGLAGEPDGDSEGGDGAGKDGAGGDGLGQEIEVDLALEPDRVLAEIRDSGRPFNPLQIPEPDLAVPLDGRPVGGLGVHLARQLVDVIRYRRFEGRNCVTLVKLLAGAPTP